MSGPKTIHNPLGAFGYTDLQNKLYSEVAEFKAQTAITGPAVIAINTTGNVATAATNGTASLTLGIAMNSPAANEIADVVISGIAENVPICGTAAAGDLLIRASTTAGRVMTSASPAVGEYLGTAIMASTGANETVDVWVSAR